LGPPPAVNRDHEENPSEGRGGNHEDGRIEREDEEPRDLKTVTRLLLHEVEISLRWNRPRLKPHDVGAIEQLAQGEEERKLGRASLRENP
jgi:hypothetical protein